MYNLSNRVTNCIEIRDHLIGGVIQGRLIHALYGSLRYADADDVGDDSNDDVDGWLDG